MASDSGTTRYLAGIIAVATAVVVFPVSNFIVDWYRPFFYHRLAVTVVEPPTMGLPRWIGFVPAVGGSVAGVMAQYGSRRIDGDRYRSWL